ncbi:dihydroxyacetone kinase [Schizopora paradoxa]|uniref:Dihydroxyacetone kinase n=1 Tax=Schizopora paradoxa TaxID=27342 RepID=A0A0H2RTE2_9AGAM|nr:dihydroxyacetone kinase [Schizopora paradoxa]
MASDKHFLDSPSTLVLDSLQGLCGANPSIQLDPAQKVVYQSNPDKSKVALICGGGSGHEPAHAGYVGKGMLNAAVCGNIFSSPNANQVRRGIELVENEKGTIIIVKNYTGDILNFGLAKEHYAASHPDKIDNIRFVIVGDDVAVGRTQGSIVGRRGLAGTVLVYKIAGALADKGASLDEVHLLAEWVSSRLGTVGVGLDHCHVPGTERSKSHLSAEEVEIGMGIHNEPGHSRIALPSLSELTAQLLNLITNTSDPERSFVPFKNDGSDEVVLVVNNLGGLSELEIGGIVKSSTSYLASKMKIHRVLVGSFMTSLNMPGFSLTLLLLPHPSEAGIPSTSEILELLDAPAQAPGWRWSSNLPPITLAQTAARPTEETANTSAYPKISAPDSDSFSQAITSACEALIKAEPEITRMDTIAGDGDCGLTLKAGAEAVLKVVQSGTISGQDVIGAMLSIANQTEKAMGGTSGALYSIFFSALAQSLISETKSQGSTMLSNNLWASALSNALQRLYTYTRARPPSRTLVDPLSAFVDTFCANPDDYASAVKQAGDAAEATRLLLAKAGRSAYVASDRLKEENIPDPGAWGVKVILEHML